MDVITLQTFENGKIGLWYKGINKETNKMNYYYAVHEWSPYGKMVLKIDENQLEKCNRDDISITFTLKNKTYKVFNSLKVKRNVILSDIAKDVFPNEKNKEELAAIQVCIPGDNKHYRIITGELIDKK